jgi:hypothetical protein
MDKLTITIQKDLLCIKIKKELKILQELKPLPKKYISCIEALHDKLGKNVYNK